MVRVLQKHTGASGTLTKKKTKFGKKLLPNQMWSKGKDFYREAIEDLEEAVKC